MNDINWNHPKYAANPLLMGMAWQAAMMQSVIEGNMQKYYPLQYQAMQAIKQLTKG